MTTGPGEPMGEIRGSTEFERPPGPSDPVATYADDLAALVSQVEALVERTGSLRDVRMRGRLTNAKRTKLTELDAHLDGLRAALGSLIAGDGREDETRAALKLEHERFQRLGGEYRWTQ